MPRPRVVRTEVVGPDRWGRPVVLGCSTSLFLTSAAAVLAVVVIGAAVRGCAPDPGHGQPAPIGVTRTSDAIVLVVPSCADPVSAISLYELTGSAPLWRTQAPAPTRLSLVVLGSPPGGFAASNPPLDHLPAEPTQLRVTVDFAGSRDGAPSTTTAPGATTASSTAPGSNPASGASGGSGGAGSEVLTSSEVVFRQSDLRDGEILLDGTLVRTNDFDSAACQTGGS